MNRWLIRATGAATALTLAGCGGSASRHDTLTISSPAVGPDGFLAARYTCDGPNVAPPLHFAGPPRHAAGMALALLDLDARSGGGPFLHWVVFDIPRDVLVEPENQLPPGAQQAATSFGSARYQGPCPPAGSPHHYSFVLYAERTKLRLTAGMPGPAALAEIRAGAVATAQLAVTYARRG